MKDQTKTICIRISKKDLKSVEEQTIKQSYTSGKTYKYTDFIRDAIKEKIYNENN